MSADRGRPVSRASIVGSILKKDFLAFTRDRVYLFLTILGLVFFIVIFWLLPDTVDETITLAVSPSVETLVEEASDTLLEMGADPETLAELEETGLTGEEQEGLELLQFESAEDLRAVVAGELEAWRTEGGELTLVDPEAGEEAPEGAERLEPQVGVVFPEDFIVRTAAAGGIPGAGPDGGTPTVESDGGTPTVESDGGSGIGPPTVTVYADASIPPELEEGVTGFVREAAYQVAGHELPVVMPDEETIILGTDRAGDQISLREKMRPMLAFFVLMMETFSLASLISTEVMHRTVTAVMVTPAKLGDFLAAKTLYGAILALGQAIILLLAVRAFTPENWALLLGTVLVGAFMFTGIAMVVGSAGKDFMGTLFYAMAMTVPLIIPAVSVLFPGSSAAWVKVLPTYGIIKVLVEVTAYGGTWGDALPYLGVALLWVVALYGVGLLTLKRKVEAL